MLTESQLRAEVRARLDLPVPAVQRLIRQSAGVSQQQIADVLAEKVGCHLTRAAVHNWENGRRTPRGQLLIAYGQLLADLRKVAKL